MATAFGELTAAVGELPRHWWVVGLRGLAAIVFGILAFAWPALTLTVLILLFGAYAIVDGVLSLYAAVRSGGRQIWALLFEGIIGVVAGLVAFLLPGLTALALLFVIAAWAILTGAFEVVTAIRLRQVIQHEWAMIFAGVISVLFGALLVAQPAAGALAVVWLIGIYAVIFGIALLVLAWRLRETLQESRGTTSGAHQTTAA
jgi:uncharacterized membrane protein HdeD (DUF308 family)